MVNQLGHFPYLVFIIFAFLSQTLAEGSVLSFKTPQRTAEIPSLIAHVFVRMSILKTAQTPEPPHPFHGFIQP